MTGMCYLSLDDYKVRESERDIERRDAHIETLMRMRKEAMPEPPKGLKIITLFTTCEDVILARRAVIWGRDGTHAREWHYLIDLSTLTEREWEDIWMEAWSKDQDSLNSLFLEGAQHAWDPVTIRAAFDEMVAP